MNRTTLLTSAAIALLLGIASSSASTETDDTSGSTVRVESAGTDGGAPRRTAQVQSADYADDARSAELLPKPGMSPLLLGAITAAFLAVAFFFGFRRRRVIPPAR